MKRTLLVAAALLSLSCARQGAIPGGPPDRVPPIVVAVEPEPETIAHDWDGPIRIEFNERISERGAEGSLDDAVLVSPAVEGLRVSHSRMGLEVSAPGGFEAGRVYRVTVLPRISDLFSNRMRDPFEFVFSTGPEISNAVAAGLVEDRLTGEPAAVRVDAVAEDSTVHFTQTGTDGLFALRYLPTGRYRLRAYDDRNRNGEPDFSEPVGGLIVALPSDSDTSLTTFSILLPDTSSARAVRFEVLDSASVRIEFDDYLDPEENLTLVGVSLGPDTAIADSLLPESTLPTPGFDRVMHQHEFQEYQRQVRELRAAEAAAEARARAQAAADSAAPALRPPAVVENVQDPAEEQADEGPPRPSQSIVAVFSSPLQPRYPYRLRVTGVRNINRVPLGQGSLAVVWDPPQEDSASLGDSLAVDTLAIDTTGVAAPDSAPTPPDTLAVDTTGVGLPPDTGAVVGALSAGTTAFERVVRGVVATPAHPTRRRR